MGKNELPTINSNRIHLIFEIYLGIIFKTLQKFKKWEIILKLSRRSGAQQVLLILK
jgi:hypothetical protein